MLFYVILAVAFTKRLYKEARIVGYNVKSGTDPCLRLAGAIQLQKTILYRAIDTNSCQGATVEEVSGGRKNGGSPPEGRCGPIIIGKIGFEQVSPFHDAETGNMSAFHIRMFVCL